MLCREAAGTLPSSLEYVTDGIRFLNKEYANMNKNRNPEQDIQILPKGQGGVLLILTFEDDM